MAQIIKTETIALSETEVKAFEVVTNILKDISRETDYVYIEAACNDALENIYSFLEFTE